MSNKRMRGIAVHRSILIGSTSTPLTPAEKLLAPPDHTHKWTVSVRSAASHPLPSLSAIAGLPSDVKVESGSEIAAMAISTAATTQTQSASPSSSSSASKSIGTRGKESEMDYHKMVGGKDDISHFIKRAQFKLHDTYNQPTRNIDKPPYNVTETGWGEFEIQVKIFFVPEANEKPITVFHHLKLHPWLNSVVPVEPSVAALAHPGLSSTLSANNDGSQTSASGEKPDGNKASEQQEGKDASHPITIQDVSKDMQVDATDKNALAPQDASISAPAGTLPSPPPVLPPVVHSWQYDEIVFPEPTEAFYEILLAHPPTPLPLTSAQAFLDPLAYRSYQLASTKSSEKSLKRAKVIPPHPLYAPTGYLFDALSQEAQLSESTRLDMARISAVKELEKGREQLIKAEKALKEARNKIHALTATATTTASTVANLKTEDVS